MSSRQDKVTTERHTRTLRELVKLPENKVCADCKRNDPRWASWNIGAFLCIRCSGIHRSMGTHISKVKSVDLDVWTSEQMQSIQKWGNHLANLYWEAHLKAGHVPPEHKIESFIRSKYESRRWAMDGPPPHDPSSLANGQSSPAPSNNSNPPPQPSRQNVASPPSQTTQPSSTRQPHVHQLLSSSQRTTDASRKPVANPPPAAEPPQPAPAPQNDLFSLDFNNPTPAVQQDVAAVAAPKKDVKNDILSLFSSSTPAAATGSLWNAPVQQQPQQQQQQFGQATSMAGTQGVGMWGTSSGWNDQPAAQLNNVWGNPTPMNAPAPANDLFGGSNVWGSSNTTTSSSNNMAGGAPKKDDVFGDIWSGFK
ncbi:hypothetical protein BDV98DRAFT_555086 [Pterulicium gracile]|uniref:Arf-GAP domain-containing protein n=1 Tax=Pterulicium gracile TaxID=1884261 RepID=A0A5C3Q547_9AGAR|nr:hypothetical protein BDV98DRAFT_555086 [Pterula gracilis]